MQNLLRRSTCCMLSWIDTMQKLDFLEELDLIQLVFPHFDVVASDITKSAEVKSVSAQESGSLQEASVRNDRDYINGEQAVGLTPNSSSLSDDTGEIVQIPLDDNELFCSV